MAYRMASIPMTLSDLKVILLFEVFQTTTPQKM